VLSAHWKAGGRLWSLTSTGTLMYSSSDFLGVPLWPGVSSYNTPCAPLRQSAPEGAKQHLSPASSCPQVRERR